MLTDQQRHLIAAAVDGCLSPSEQLGFRGLLAESRDALTLFRTLQSQSARLAALPKFTLPHARTETILQALAQAAPPTAPLATPRVAARRSPTWLPYTVAASTLLAVAAASFWFAQDTPRGPLAQQPPARTATAAPPQLAAVSITATLDAELPAPREVTPPLLARAEPVAPDELAPEPRPKGTADLVGSGTFQQRANLAAIEVRLPILTAASKLDQADIRVLTLAEVNASGAVRLDLFSRDTPRAAQVLLSALKAVGVTAAVDGLTGERLKKPLPIAYAVYTESLTPDDFTKLLDLVAVANREAGKDAPFGTAHLAAAGAPEVRDVKELLGFEPAFLKRSAPPTAVSAATADRLTQALVKPAKSGVVVTFGPPAARTPPASSPEIRGYAANRGERKSGTTPVLIVVRPAG